MFECPKSDRIAMTLDEFIEYNGITPDNIDEVAADYGRHWHGVACSEFSFWCNTKGVALGYENDIGYRFVTWKEVKRHLDRSQQITFF